MANNDSQLLVWSGYYDSVMPKLTSHTLTR